MNPLYQMNDIKWSVFENFKLPKKMVIANRFLLFFDFICEER